MLLRALKPRMFRGPTHLAEASLPVKIGRSNADMVFARPLDRQIRALGLGQVTGTGVRRGKDGEVEGVDIFFALVTLHPRALRTIGGLLEELDAPLGSVIEFSDTGVRHLFGRTEGLGLYLDRRDGIACEDDALDLLEVCTDALGAEAIYQGSEDLGDRAVFYFYGDSFNTMKTALSLLMTSHPQFRNAYARRLT
ncbi:hypothetical protein ACRDNQ_05540 [Palleronia sp. KMU-117]|uniref:hypothetical protein n=1 Tax=Palleronia sp. KMU-117 TaxID=3434108 RepID=UPI003D71FF2F